MKSIRAWLGIDASENQEIAPLRDTLEALDHLEPERARYLAAFAYLLGRVAHADQHVSPEETAAMEALVRRHGQLSPDQAMVVVQLAKSSNLLFGGTANFLVAREFSQLATYEQKLALMDCLFAAVSGGRGYFVGRRRRDSPDRQRASHRSPGSHRPARGAPTAPARHVARVIRVRRRCTTAELAHHGSCCGVICVQTAAAFSIHCGNGISIPRTRSSSARRILH